MRAKTDARRAARRALAKLGEPEADPHTGVLVCTSCGSVQRPREEMGCGHCGAWPLLPANGDLFSQAIAVPSAEDLQRSTRANAAAKAQAIAMVAASIGVGATFLYFLATAGGKGYQVAPVLALMVLVLFGVPAVAVLVRNVQAAFADETLALPNPTPWMRALPGSGAVAGASGLILANDPLKAPLTHRACAAYEVAVRRRGSKDEGAWVHVQTHNAALKVGRVRADVDAVRLSTGRQPIIVDDTSTPVLQAYLASVGLTADVEQWDVFESVAVVRARGTLTVDEDGEATLHV
ncbi:MAG: hypothetical protein AAGA54_09940 [Myxococcota bacterium]